MSSVNLTGTFANITDAQNALMEINQVYGNNYYWTNAYDGNPGIRNQVWGSMGSVYGGQIGGFIGSNMDMLIFTLNSFIISPLAFSQGIFQPVNYYANPQNIK